MRTRNIVGIGLFAFGLVSYVVTQHFSFAADKPHSGFVYASIEFVRDLSIRGESRSVSVPRDLDSPERLRRASGNYDAMCATCHLKPGVSQSELSKGLYPTPPDLTQTRDRSDAASDFWVVKHGIKGSGSKMCVSCQLKQLVRWCSNSWTMLGYISSTKLVTDRRAAAKSGQWQ